MSVDSSSIKIYGLKELLQKMQRPHFKRRLASKVRGATIRNLNIGSKAVKKAITSGSVRPKNKPSTAAMKGSNRSLVDSRKLSQGIRGGLMAWNKGAIGVIHSWDYKKQDGSRISLDAVATILHGGKNLTGITINVTDKMRRFFAKMATLSEQGKVKGTWHRLSPSTTRIRIPPRPFLQYALTSELVRVYMSNWLSAVMMSLEGIKGQPKSKSK